MKNPLSSSGLLILMKSNLNLDLLPSPCISFKRECTITRNKTNFTAIPNPYVALFRTLAISRSLPGSGGIPIEVNERLSHPAAYSELCRGISRLSLDAYCR